MQSVALCTALALGFQAPGAFVSRRTTAIVASEEPPTKDATEIFTLQDREDGWDDVRGSIKDAIKDREKPIALVREKYVEPAKRWSKAFAEVTAETLDEVGITSGSVVPTNLPNLKAPALPSFADEQRPRSVWSSSRLFCSGVPVRPNKTLHRRRMGRTCA